MVSNMILKTTRAILEFAQQLLVLEWVGECENVALLGTEAHKLAEMPPETKKVWWEEQLEDMQLVFISSGPSAGVETAHTHPRHTHAHTLINGTINGWWAGHTERDGGDSEKHTLYRVEWFDVWMWCSRVGLKPRSASPMLPAGSAPSFILHPADSASITLSDATAPSNTVLQALA